MTKCTFCGNEESPYKGVHQINNDGSTKFFCSSKCRKNALKLKRDRKKVKWTEAHMIFKKKAVDKAKKQAEAEAKKDSKTEVKKEKSPKSKR